MILIETVAVKAIEVAGFYSNNDCQAADDIVNLYAGVTSIHDFSETLKQLK